MLRTLRVRDLAIIEELEILLEPVSNVVTGETGAGKSILLQALDVALGGRPDADLVRTGARRARSRPCSRPLRRRCAKRWWRAASRPRRARTSSSSAA
jgi:recombinational DNA repair ATPase RecF